MGFRHMDYCHMDYDRPGQNLIVPQTRKPFFITIKNHCIKIL